LLDALGRSVKRIYKGPGAAGETSWLLPMSEVPEGQYFVVYKSSNALFRIPVIKAN
jgi:hypothetical protein